MAGMRPLIRQGPPKVTTEEPDAKEAGGDESFPPLLQGHSALRRWAMALMKKAQSAMEAEDKADIVPFRCGGKNSYCKPRSITFSRHNIEN